MTRRDRLRRRLTHPARRRTMWQRVKRGKKHAPDLPEWRYRAWEYATGRLR